MKRVIYTIAAALAILLTACSFFNKEEIEYGSYTCEVELTGGSGRATVESPAEVEISKEGNTVKLIWSSKNYDYMLVDNVRYDNEADADSNSVFTIPFAEFDKPFNVIGDTTAMSTPHEIEYQITVYAPGHSLEAGAVEKSETEAASDSYKLTGLTLVDSLKLDYAKGFSVDYYVDDEGNGYKFISISGINGKGDNQYFLMAQKALPDSVSVSDNVSVIVNTDKTYLVSTSVMDLMDQIGALDDIAFSGTKAKDWYIKNARTAMKNGEMAYAGKYSTPDYELLVSSGCNFAIENTMIYHTPETLEKLKELGIPVLVEMSSYETSPLARLEWIKLYGCIYGKEDKANEVFENQVARVDEIGKHENTGKTVAFFSINSNGQIVVRKPKDYIASMIGLAGGKYVPDDISSEEDNALSTMKITTEDFYIRTVDADVLIYNSTIEGEISSIAELVKEEEALADYKAVKEGNVYCLKEGYFQKSTNVAEFIEELNEILSGS
ncbi:ABC transporter substrate-binding protein, partial [Pseudobutyrivibrio sp.]